MRVGQSEDAAVGESGKTEEISDDLATIGDASNLQRVASSQPNLSKARLCALVLTLTGATFLNTVSVQAAVIVLPTIGRDLNIPEARQQWVVSAYSLTFACFLLLWSRLADVYGKRMIFLTGCIWVTIATLVNPFMPNEISFDVVRGLQGLGAAANVPTAIGILGVTFPPGKAKNYAISCYSAGFALGSVAGNLLGGVLGEYASWKWVFWVLTMLAAITTLAAYFVVPNDSPPLNDESVKSAVDWIGGTIITIGLLILVFALTEGNVEGWSTPWIPALIVVAFIFIFAFNFWQWYLENKTSRRPLMKLSIWKAPRFAAAQIIMALFFGAFNNYLIFATFYYQDYLGLSVIQTTIRFIPTGVVGFLTSLVSSQILSRIRGNYILFFGTLCVSLSCLLFAIPIPTSTSYWAYGFEAMCLSVFGADTLYPCLALFTIQSLPKEDQAMGGGIVNAMGQLGRVIGLAVATAIQTRIRNNYDDRHHKGLLESLRAAEWFSFGYALTGAVVVLVAFRGVGKVGALKK